MVCRKALGLYFPNLSELGYMAIILASDVPSSAAYSIYNMPITMVSKHLGNLIRLVQLLL